MEYQGIYSIIQLVIWMLPQLTSFLSLPLIRRNGMACSISFLCMIQAASSVSLCSWTHLCLRWIYTLRNRCIFIPSMLPLQSLKERAEQPATREPQKPREWLRNHQCPPEAMLLTNLNKDALSWQKTIFNFINVHPTDESKQLFQSSFKIQPFSMKAQNTLPQFCLEIELQVSHKQKQAWLIQITMK